ncbi:uncharacterized protein LOC18444265 isoform X1 [Amborella trichopoda]|uniref:RING-CH-type domain-containing protein n=1 Tax=Amborella trichopoda TaxID=13333 RepID=U5D0M0_AMBTC|nr:uncharacterized protein LOC18444265 isoform X1 [Amborella trichopoda]ERN15969.1 hypothetical protein AMTR_s00175p00053490 [Amborella trichopoda]|eukprot:XP_006854502.1 uncharacterized protein LOC18444265 isoform X1 [Amborella trichopoda]
MGAEDNDDRGLVPNVSSSSKLQQVEESTGISEEIPSVHQRRKPNLLLEIPPRSLEGGSSSGSVRINMPPTPSPTYARVSLSPSTSLPKGKSSIRNILPWPSFKSRGIAFDNERASTPPSALPREKSLVRRSFSLTKMFLPSPAKRTSSLPVTPVGDPNSESVRGRSDIDQCSPITPGVQKHMPRSLSVPVIIKARSLKRTDSIGALYRIIPSTPHVPEVGGATSNSAANVNADSEDAGEDIPEEEAVCRICLVELSEGGDSLKMECSCKGELALAHQECAVKWFSLKGNKNCDVCKQEVRNLPVTLLRIQSSQTAGLQSTRARGRVVQHYRVWQDVPVLVMVSMLAYFCFLEQLLVTKMGSGALAISLPFSCVLGLLASMTTSSMVRKKYIWIYASAQFALVVIFAHLFYSLLHVQVVLSVLLSAFGGFGVTMTANSLLHEFLRWRTRWRNWQEARHHAQQENPMPQNTIQSETNTSENRPSIFEIAQGG